MNDRITVCIKDMYPNGYKIPAGYRAVGFRRVRIGDTSLDTLNCVYTWPTAPIPFTVRIILEKVTLPKWTVEVIEAEPRTLVFPEVGVQYLDTKTPEFIYGPSQGYVAYPVRITKTEG